MWSKKLLSHFPLQVAGRFGVWRLVSLLVFGFLAGSFLVSSYFVYNHIFHTLDAATTIVALNASLNDTIDVANFIKAEKMLQQKQSVSLLPPIIRFPFNYGKIISSTIGVSPITTPTLIRRPSPL